MSISPLTLTLLIGTDFLQTPGKPICQKQVTYVDFAMRHPVCMQYICLAFIFLYAITMFTPRKLSTDVCFWSKVICL